ncbi:MAG TPA: alpha/beta fold hydrolase [Chthoniobacterales bacterium]|nr:alpha/beta fold hydrolase [Chthoniobacterales bacterium]
MKGKVVLTLAMSTLLFTSAKSESWRGLYRKEDDGIVGVGELHEFGKDEVLVDYTTGETGVLYSLGEGRAGIGRAIGEKSPPPVRVLERRNGQVSVDGHRLTPIMVRQRMFQIESGGVRLAGDFVIPGGKSKGTIVVVHGSGDGPRRAYDLWTNFFLSRGWAVVVFDKRGSGESTGDWHDADFVTLAGDVRKVVQWTRAQQEVAGLKIGVWGASQAGWIIPQLTAENAVDFAIIQAGPATPVDDFLRQTLESELGAYGFPPDEIAKAVRYYELDTAVSRGAKPFLEIEKAYAKATAAGAEWLLKPPDPINAPDRRFMAAISGFDAADYWRKTRTPMLILFGGKDHVVPVEPNRRRAEQLLADAGNRRGRIVVLENDNHLNMLAKSGVRTEYPTLNRFDPEYYKTVTAYLEEMAPEARRGP